MLEVSNLECARGGRTLFAGLSFALNPGAWLHLRGPNGAGKTSLLRILCGLTQPVSGAISWRGQPVAADRARYRAALFYLGHQLALNDALSVGDNLRFCAALAGDPCPDEVLRRALASFGLRGLERRPVRNLSWGQRRRVALARLAFTRSWLWILDEPFVALDAGATRLLGDLVAGHLERGGLAVITSHQDVAIGGRAPEVLELAA